MLWRNAPVIRMAELSEKIKGTAHIRFPTLRCAEQRQVYRAAPAVAGALCDVSSGYERGFFQIRVEISLHALIFRVRGPAHEMGDGGLRTVGVVDFQPEAFRCQIAADQAQGLGSFPGQQCYGLLIPVDPAAYKVEGGEVPDVQKDIGNRVCQQHKVRGVPGEGRSILCSCRKDGEQGQDQRQEKEKKNGFCHFCDSFPQARRSQGLISIAFSSSPSRRRRAARKVR